MRSLRVILLILCFITAGILYARVSLTLPKSHTAALTAAGATQLYATDIRHSGRTTRLAIHHVPHPALLREGTLPPNTRVIQLGTTRLTLTSTPAPDAVAASPVWPRGFPPLGSAIPTYVASTSSATLGTAATTEHPTDVLNRLHADLLNDGWYAPYAPTAAGAGLYTRGDTLTAIAAHAGADGRTTLTVLQRTANR